MEATPATTQHISGDRHGASPAGRSGRAARWIMYVAPRAISPECLSPRELDVLALVATGRTDVEIAERLSISPRTVGAHISNMLNKTCVSNRVELVIWAIASEVLGLLPQGQSAVGAATATSSS